MTVTALSITVSSPAFQLTLRTKLQVIPRKRSHSKDVPRRIRLPSIYSVPDRACRSLEISGEIRISVTNRDIEKILVSLRSFVLCPNVSKLPKW
ncbi:hypothetical protein AVEN_180627-1 [Araneus ventricosus]|uniref:Uncharacterized protein n=1 Tax=Araneus ventricosus TaxID=182803 RepID=A0A4Y2WXI8_ARAVE|nr:hypothetical protein AVEN_180627-1 [Araneus ventricosus]